MSADNAIVILRTVRTANEEKSGVWTIDGIKRYVYRVAHVSAWDNFRYYEEKQPYNLGAYLKEVFGCSKVYFTPEEAILAAHALKEKVLEETHVLEYGVVVEDTEYIFYDDI